MNDKTYRGQTRITLRNVKHVASMSEETFCYTATVCFDGKPVCVAKNRGHGGCDDYDIVKRSQDRDDMWQDINEMGAYLNTLDAEPSDLFEDGWKPDLEGVCHHLVAVFLDQRQLKNKLRRNWVICDPKEAGRYRQIKKNGQDTEHDIIQHIAKVFPNEVLINTLDLDEACRLYYGSHYSAVA